MLDEQTVKALEDVAAGRITDTDVDMSELEARGLIVWYPELTKQARVELRKDMLDRELAAGEVSELSGVAG